MYLCVLDGATETIPVPAPRNKKKMKMKMPPPPPPTSTKSAPPPPPLRKLPPPPPVRKSSLIKEAPVVVPPKRRNHSKSSAELQSIMNTVNCSTPLIYNPTDENSPQSKSNSLTADNHVMIDIIPNSAVSPVQVHDTYESQVNYSPPPAYEDLQNKLKDRRESLSSDFSSLSPVDERKLNAKSPQVEENNNVLNSGEVEEKILDSDFRFDHENFGNSVSVPIIFETEDIFILSDAKEFAPRVTVSHIKNETSNFEKESKDINLYLESKSIPDQMSENYSTRQASPPTVVKYKDDTWDSDCEYSDNFDDTVKNIEESTNVTQNTPFQNPTPCKISNNCTKFKNVPDDVVCNNVDEFKSEGVLVIPKASSPLPPCLPTSEPPTVVNNDDMNAVSNTPLFKFFTPPVFQRYDPSVKPWQPISVSKIKPVEFNLKKKIDVSPVIKTQFTDKRDFLASTLDNVDSSSRTKVEIDWPEITPPNSRRESLLEALPQ